tara:strand:+ start:108 stop:845 length:738 start_codon:yes stop_codon:yes gene_type:complete
MKALITFGCSWTKGKGSFYPMEGMSKDEFFNNLNHELDAKYAFRTILSKKHRLKNINFAKGGSSNSAQFRCAEEYFNTDDYKKYDKVIVLWGITATSRGEFWDDKNKKYTCTAYSVKHDKPKLGDFMREGYYNHEIEVKRLSTQMQHWDNYFNLIGVKNYWFDTFNHHDYDYNSPNMIFGNDNPRDLLSKLSIDNSDGYHHSVWTRDSGRIKNLEKRNLINPHTLHPNIDCHIKIADMLDKFVNF